MRYVILVELDRRDLDADDRLRIARETHQLLGTDGVHVCSRESAIQKLGNMDP